MEERQVDLFARNMPARVFPSSDGRMKTLDEARDQLRASLDDGSTCPCCGQYARRYRRKLNSTMAAGLVWLVGRAGDARSFVNVSKIAPRFIVKTNEIGTLKHWRLVEQNVRPDGTSAPGVWRPTKDGALFAGGGCVVPRHAFVYNGKADGFSIDTTDIHRALGDSFDHAELMRGGR